MVAWKGVSRINKINDNEWGLHRKQACHKKNRHDRQEIGRIHREDTKRSINYEDRSKISLFGVSISHF